MNEQNKRIPRNVWRPGFTAERITFKGQVLRIGSPFVSNDGTLARITAITIIIESPYPETSLILDDCFGETLEGMPEEFFKTVPCNLESGEQYRFDYDEAKVRAWEAKR